MSKPKNWPRLSETLSEARHPEICQSCGCVGSSQLPLARWLECDLDDNPGACVVVLCEPCEKRLIEPHPRLYIRLAKHEPMAGSMPICIGCTHREGVQCTHPDLKSNGGGGLGMTFPLPTRAFVDWHDKQGRRSGGIRTLYMGPVSKCMGRVERAEEGATA